MNKAIIIHGMMSDAKYHDTSRIDSSSNSHWLPWLQMQLCARDILTQTPEMPRPFAPDYEAWKNVFEQFEINEHTLLVGHSCGGGFIMRWLSDNLDRKVGKVVLVAPWLDIERDYGSMFDFELRADISGQSTGGIDYLYSTNDGSVLKTTLQFSQKVLSDIKYHEFVDYGHFMLENMNTREFPELLAICLGV